MALADRFEEYEKLSQKPCPFILMLESLNPQDREAMTAALDRGTPWKVIQRALRAEGIPCSAESYLSHRRKECRCLK